MTAEAFFKELKRLIDITPNYPLHQENNENCEYADHDYYCKNLSYCFDCVKCTDGIYLYDTLDSANCVDCDYVGQSELCYESVDAFKCFNSNYIQDCTNMTDSSFSVRCNNCHDVFGCVALKNKSFCIFNRQLTEEEYREKIKIYKTWPVEKIIATVKQIWDRFPVTQTHEANNENSSYGDFFYFNKNCYMLFDASNSKDSGYLYDSNSHISSYDVTYSTEGELCYQEVDCGQCYNCNYIVYSAKCLDSSYVINGLDVKNCLGSVNRTHAQYEILNRKFSKEDYEKLSGEILEDINRKNLGWADLTFH